MSEQPVIEVDLEAIAHNFAASAAAVKTPVVPVIKANAYGHGMRAVAQTVINAGAPMLAVVDAREALSLRASGIDAPILNWLHAPNEDWAAQIAANLEIGISSMQNLGNVAQAAATSRTPASVQLKLDTGLGRNGARESDWRTLFAHARELERAGNLRITGLFSHFSGTSRKADHAQIEAFERALALAEETGLTPKMRHLAATAGALRYPKARFDAVRLGIALYGLSPFSPAEKLPRAFTTGPLAEGLRPALQLTAPVRSVDGAWQLEVGFADGLLPLRAGLTPLIDSAGTMWQVERIEPTRTIVSPVEEKTVKKTKTERTLVVIGASASADAWAEASDTINYEVTTRLGTRIPRHFTGTAPEVAAPLEPTSMREAIFDADAASRRLARIARRAGNGARAKDAPAAAIDVSADAYGHGLARILPLLREAGLGVVVRTELDLARVREGGFTQVHLDRDAGPETREFYGFDPESPASTLLTLRSGLVLVKRVRAGQGVSYGYRWRAKVPTTLGLVPMGYGDGIPRNVEGKAHVMVAGERRPIVGRIAMDQVVVDLGDAEAWAGMPVKFWESDPEGISLDEWANWSGIPAEGLCAALGPRVRRVTKSARA